MSTSPTRADFTVDFDPKDYLNTYYAAPDPEDRFIIRFMVAMLRQWPPGLLALEFGGGPTLYAVAVMAARAREIHFCDYVTANLAEVRRWLNNEADSYDWTPYIRMVLEEEASPITPEAVTRRAAAMRQKVTSLLGCDAMAAAPMGQGCVGKYDLVVAQAVTDSVAATLPEWLEVMANISTLVSPGGGLLISVITGTKAYHVGQKSFPNLHLTNEDIYEGYLALGYDPASFYIETMAAPEWRDYAGLITAMARKPRS